MFDIREFLVFFHMLTHLVELIKGLIYLAHF